MNEQTDTPYGKEYEPYYDEEKSRWNFRLKDSTAEVKLASLVGKHTLSGVDLTNRVAQVTEWREAEKCQVCNFVLDGKTYTAIEDPSDGYRSSLGKLFISSVAVSNNFSPVEVLCIHRTEGRSYSKDDVLCFYDIGNGKLVLEVGTKNSDDYYPSFVSDWNPANLAANSSLF